MTPKIHLRKYKPYLRDKIPGVYTTTNRRFSKPVRWSESYIRKIINCFKDD